MNLNKIKGKDLPVRSSSTVRPMQLKLIELY